jgi:cobalt-zinc-cadmium efflux system outer membrane protein
MSDARAMQPQDSIRLSLAEARSIAIRSNPELAAVRQDTAIARGLLRQAGLLRFNPTADVLAGSGSTTMEPSLSQEFELFGQRGARKAQARAAFTRADGQIVSETRLTIGAVDRAFYRLSAATRRSILADEVLALNQRLTDVAGRQLAAGEISRLDYNFAVVELGRSRSRALATRRDQSNAGLELSRLLGFTPATAIVPLVDTLRAGIAPDGVLEILQDRGGRIGVSLDSLTSLAFTHRGDLSAVGASVLEAKAATKVAVREALPNLIGRITSEAGESGRVVRPGIGIALPLFNRNQGEVQARRGQVAQAELNRQALVLRIREEIYGAVASYESAASEAQILATTVLEPARQNRQLLEVAYREGKVGLPVLLLIRNQVVDAELEYWTAWLAQREALANLGEATGLNAVNQPRS